MTDHCPDGALLLAFAEGRATSEEARRLEAHAAECPRCAVEIEALRHLIDALRTAESGRPAATSGASVAPGISGRADGSCGCGFDAWAFLDGSLDGDARLAFEMHAAGCALCREELSDLMAARRQDAPVVADGAVTAVFERLRRERSRVVFRISEGALQFVEGWIESAANFVARTGFEVREPAFAGVRSDEPPVTLHWESEGGYMFDCELTSGPAGSELVGRVLREGAPATDVSVALRGTSEPRGPESVDSAGRFGPWHLAEGASELRFEALRLATGSLAVTLEIGADAAVPDENDRSGA